MASSMQVTCHDVQFSYVFISSGYLDAYLNLALECLGEHFHALEKKVTLWIQKVPLIMLGSWVEENNKGEDVTSFWAEPSIGACH